MHDHSIQVDMCISNTNQHVRLISCLSVNFYFGPPRSTPCLGPHTSDAVSYCDMWIEHGTFRSSVWRSPMWAKSANTYALPCELSFGRRWHTHVRKYVCVRTDIIKSICELLFWSTLSNSMLVIPQSVPRVFMSVEDGRSYTVPSDLQSDALPCELSPPIQMICSCFIINIPTRLL